MLKCTRKGMLAGSISCCIIATTADESAWLPSASFVDRLAGSLLEVAWPLQAFDSRMTRYPWQSPQHSRFPPLSTA